MPTQTAGVSACLRPILSCVLSLLFIRSHRRGAHAEPERPLPAAPASLYRRRLVRRHRRQDRRRHQPRHRRHPRHGATHGHARDPACDRGRQRRLAGLAQDHRARTRPDPAQVERPDAGKRRRSRRHHDCRTRQAAGGIQGRNRLRRLVLRMVRRAGQAHRRRRAGSALARAAHRGHQAADRGVRRDHAVELPGRDDHPQGRPGAGGRLPDRAEAGRADAVFGAGAGAAGRTRRRAEGRVLDRDRRFEDDRRRDVRQPDRSQAQLYGFDAGRPPT